jgi:hypothetical protein
MCDARQVAALEGCWCVVCQYHVCVTRRQGGWREVGDVHIRPLSFCKGRDPVRGEGCCMLPG